MIINGNGFLMTEVYSMFKSIKARFKRRRVIMINRNWERVKNLPDVLKIVLKNRKILKEGMCK